MVHFAGRNPNVFCSQHRVELSSIKYVIYTPSRKQDRALRGRPDASVVHQQLFGSCGVAAVPQGAAAITHTTNFHLVLHSVYKNPADAKWEQLQLLEELTLQRLDELNVDSLITVMFAFARSSYRPDDRIQTRMAEATEADMASFTPRQLEHAAWSLAHMHFRPSAGWLQNFADALQVNWDYFRPAQLADTLVQVAACGLTRLPPATLADQLPALLNRATDAAATIAVGPGTLAKLVWSAGHFGYGDLRGAASSAAAGAGGAAPAAQPPPPPSVATAAQQPGASGPAPASTSAAAAAAVPSPIFLSGAPRAVPLHEHDLLTWWEGEGQVEGAEPADLVLLLHGLARLGVKPAGLWTQRLLPAVLGSPAALARLDTRLLALAAWAALKLAEGPLRKDWLEAFEQALRAQLRDAVLPLATPGREGGQQGEGDSREGVRTAARAGVGLREGGRGDDAAVSRVAHIGGHSGGSGAGGGGGSGRGDGWEVRPADMALALSSLAGLGGYVAGEGDVRRYWGGAGRWSALSQEDRMVLSLLGYGP